MQVHVLSNGNPDQLTELCGKINGSSDATLFHWASRDPLVRYLLKAWQWLKPIGYDDLSALSPHLLKERGGLLYTKWREGLGAPGGLARRESPGDSTEGEESFPYVLGEGQSHRLSAVPVMLIGAPQVGKTTFLCALARHLEQSGGALGRGLHLEPSESQGFWSSKGELWAPSSRVIRDQPGAYNLRIRDDHDPQVTRWMRLALLDHEREELKKNEFCAEFLRVLRASKALLFFVDDRYFPASVPGDHKYDRSVGEEWPEDALETASWYTRILQAFLDVNKDALHLPVGLVVSKGDLLLGGPHVPPPDPPFLITEEIRMELVHAGLGYPGEPEDPFGRLRHSIRHTLSNSKDTKHQAFVFDLLEKFRGFIAAALAETYRFQIFLTSSATTSATNSEQLPYGAWLVAKWVANQLQPAYRVQARAQLEHDQAELEQLKQNIEGALLRDKAAWGDFEEACRQKDRRFAAKMHAPILDSILARDAGTIGKRIDSARETMHTALDAGFSFAKLTPVSEAIDPAPFPARRRMLQQALGRLEEQIDYLKEWRDNLSGVKSQRTELPAEAKRAVMNYVRSAVQRRWAS
jgi:hypothetical protein